MAGIDDESKKMLDDFLKTASPDEIRELYRLLDEREKRGGGLRVDVSSLAKTMSKQIQEQLGMANLNTKKMAKNMVAQMAKKYKPDITDRELNQIVNSMVPDRKPEPSVKIPSDIMKNMIIHFVAYSNGEISAADNKNMPPGWEKKYWNAFPGDIKILIAGYIKGNMSRKKFWSEVSRFLSGR